MLKKTAAHIVDVVETHCKDKSLSLSGFSKFQEVYKNNSSIHESLVILLSLLCHDTASSLNENK